MIKNQVMRIAANQWEANYVDTCRNCQGTGKVTIVTETFDVTNICKVCLGSGRVRVQKLIHITITPFKF